MSKNIVFEGWLTKSPPTKRIWRTKWRRRWFSLRQSGELPGQYFLDYFRDRNCRRLKGTINLDLCEQVDAGLHMERGNGSLDPKLKGSVFTIQTQSRTYHLEADCEAEMEKWVDAICRVCGLRATDESIDALGAYQNNVTSIAAMNEQYDCAEGTGPYIPLSNCFTGARASDTQRAFTFDPKNIVMSTRTPPEGVSCDRRHLYLSHPQITHNTELSENESNMSDEECNSVNTSQNNIRSGDWAVTKSFTRLTVASTRNGATPGVCPPVPPRPLKSFAVLRMQHKEPFQGPKIQEPDATPRLPRRMSLSPDNPPSLPPPPPPPARHIVPAPQRFADDSDHISPGMSTQYCNLGSLPPAVDRNLKPRHPSFGNANNALPHNVNVAEPAKPQVLQYLDLDLGPKSSDYKSNKDGSKKGGAHKKSLSALADYKTVDFDKTEAFNSTRQDAEAFRRVQC